jgi:hypothetical protein
MKEPVGVTRAKNVNDMVKAYEQDYKKWFEKKFLNKNKS